MWMVAVKYQILGNLVDAPKEAESRQEGDIRVGVIADERSLPQGAHPEQPMRLNMAMPSPDHLVEAAMRVRIIGAQGHIIALGYLIALVYRRHAGVRKDYIWPGIENVDTAIQKLLRPHVIMSGPLEVL